jgi:hypothetical protein
MDNAPDAPPPKNARIPFWMEAIPWLLRQPLNVGMQVIEKWLSPVPTGKKEDALVEAT